MRNRAGFVLLMGALLMPGAVSAQRSLVEEANRLYAEGRYAEAHEMYLEALRENPGSPLIRFNEGNALYQNQEFERACAVHFFPNDSLHLAQHAQAERHPGEEAGRETSNKAGAEHELVAHDLGFGRHFLERGQRELGIAHVVFRGSLVEATHFSPYPAPIARALVAGPFPRFFRARDPARS